MGKFYGVMLRIDLCNKFVQFVFSVGPNHKNVISVSPPNERFDCRVLLHSLKAQLRLAEVLCSFDSLGRKLKPIF